MPWKALCSGAATEVPKEDNALTPFRELVDVAVRQPAKDKRRRLFSFVLAGQPFIIFRFSFLFRQLRLISDV